MPGAGAWRLMAANDYHFVTRWHLRAPREAVAEVIGDAAGLPCWWPAVYLSAEVLEPGDERGEGRRVAVHTRGWLPYTLRWQFTITEAESPETIALRAEGDFDGSGRWTFEDDENGGTYVTYDWRLRAEKPLLRYGSPLLKRVFAWDHRWAMQAGEDSIRLELARRAAKSPGQLAPIPPPPGPTPIWPWLVGAGVLLAGGAFALRRLAGRTLLRGIERQANARERGAGLPAPLLLGAGVDDYEPAQ